MQVEFASTYTEKEKKKQKRKKRKEIVDGDSSSLIAEKQKQPLLREVEEKMMIP